MPDFEAMCEQSAITKCPKCHEARMIVKPTKYGTVFASCNSFPKCDNHMNMPKGIISLRMLGPDDCPPERIYSCEKCWKMRRRESFLFRLIFDP